MADPNYRALLIGNSRFPKDPQNLQTLEGPRNDVPHLFAALTDPETGLFAPTAVRTVVDHTKQEIHLELEDFFQAARRDSCLLLYYSGHGLLDESNRLFLCAFDTIRDKCRATAIRSDDIDELIETSPARATLIVLDCCHSGAFKGGDLGHDLRGAGRFLLTSCRGGELANDADVQNHASVFTSHLVEGLRGAAPEQHPDGHISLDELYAYVYGRMEADGKQRPQRHFAGGGDVAIARRRGTAAAAPTLALSESAIDLEGVQVGEDLPAERVYVTGARGWSAETTSTWIALDCRPTYFDITLHPVAGVNRAAVVVRDPASGAARTLRVTVRTAGQLAPVTDVWTVTVLASTAQTRSFRLTSGPSTHVLAYENHPVTPAVASLDGQIVGKTMEAWQTFDFALSGPAGTVQGRLEVSVAWRVQRCRLLIGGEQVYAEGIPPRTTASGLLDAGGSPMSIAVLAALRRSAIDGLYVRPDIPADKLANARRAVGLDKTAHVLAVLDRTLLGSAKDCLVFTSRSLHIKPSGSDDIVRIEYTVLRGRSVSVTRDSPWTGRRIDVGDGDIDVAGPIPASAIVELINDVKAALE